ncbi:hypothetical protein SEA_ROBINSPARKLES_11 [Gordonia phage RobinSparkles]|nr:hypothetical protein SEA_ROBINSPARKLES_11 [Gordonia phage RobinSparkles]
MMWCLCRYEETDVCATEDCGHMLSSHSFHVYLCLKCECDSFTCGQCGGYRAV